MEHPSITHEGETYFQVGCRHCGDKLGVATWEIFSNGKDFVALCGCGNKVLLRPKVLQRKPDVPKAIDMRMVV